MAPAWSVGCVVRWVLEHTFIYTNKITVCTCDEHLICLGKTNEVFESTYKSELFRVNLKQRVLEGALAVRCFGIKR